MYKKIIAYLYKLNVTLQPLMEEFFMKNQSMNRIALAILVSGFVANGIAMQPNQTQDAKKLAHMSVKARQTVDNNTFAQARLTKMQQNNADAGSVAFATYEANKANASMVKAQNKLSERARIKAYELGEKAETKATEGYVWAKANPKYSIPALVVLGTGVVTAAGFGIYKAVTKLLKSKELEKKLQLPQLLLKLMQLQKMLVFQLKK